MMRVLSWFSWLLLVLSLYCFSTTASIATAAAASSTEAISLRGAPARSAGFNEAWTDYDFATLFISIAAFRDIECEQTVRDAFYKAANPRRVFMGIIEQNEHGDPICTPREYFECRSPDFCHIDNIRRRRVAARRGKGPTWGRYTSFLSYRGEAYYMMIDSHNEFSLNWDRRVMNQIFRSRSSRPVSSTYVSGWDKNGQSYESQGNMMVLCKQIFEQHLGYTRNGARWMSRSIEPRPQPFTAAGFLFADALMVHECPFDPYLDFIFDGEEMLYSARLYTHGWDALTPGDNVVFHDYNRHKAPRYWGTHSRLGGNFNHEMAISQQRAQYILHAQKKGSDGQYAPMVSKENAAPRVLTKLDIYGLGTTRTIWQMYEMGDVNMHTRHAGEGYCEALGRYDQKHAVSPVR